MSNRITSLFITILMAATFVSSPASADVDCTAGGNTACTFRNFPAWTSVSTTPQFVMQDTDTTVIDWVLRGDEIAFSFFKNNSTSDVPFRIAYDANPQALRITGTGVGINTATPGAALHVVGSQRIDNGADFWNTEISTNGGIQFLDGRTSLLPVFFESGAPNWSLYVAGDANAGIDPGNIGFGTFAPNEAVSVERSGSASRFQVTSFTDTANEAPQFIQRRARGSLASPSQIQFQDNLGLISFRGHTGSSFTGSRAGITAQATQTWSPSGNGTSLGFFTTANNTSAPRTVMLLTEDGRVLINGTNLNVPDYVFEPEYDLMPLSDVKEFIAEYGHLPKVPSAETVNAEGLNLGESQMTLLKKIEELTLYTIQQEERIVALQAKEEELNVLRSQQNEFLQRLSNLESRLAE